MPAADRRRPARPSPRTGAGANVCVVLVVTDGARWLPSVLATIAAQDHVALDLVVVDNASHDDSPSVLARRIPEDRLVSLSRRVPFGRAVAAAATHDAVREADLLLLLHDDCALAPDAVGTLARAFLADPDLSIAGPKLREWGDVPMLAEVGMTVDRLGRAESLLEPDELDQGQHDRQREVLYLSTAAMMLRREVLRDVRGFDHRYPAFRDDLDLCWRARLRGHRVEVVPAAVGYHVAAVSNGLRRVGERGRGSAGTTRELAERHSVATLLKCYGAARLLWVLPVVLVLAVAKVLAFLVTRRFGDAASVVRAYVWNVTQLPRTIRRRRHVQRTRVVSDGEVAALFAPGLPRVRSYGEAAAGWVAGGSTKAILDEPDPETEEPVAEDGIPAPAWLKVPREHPALCAGAALLLLYVVGMLRILPGAPLLGGEVAPWPDSPWTFLRTWAAAWGTGPLGSAAPASPVSAVLGVVSTLGLGSAWLAQRVVVLGLVPLAWVTALRAGRLVTTRPAPRVLGATLYAASPVVLGALAEGMFSVMVVAALLPALVLLVVRTVAPGEVAGADVRPGAATSSAWRAAALLGIGVVVAVGAAPRLWFLPALLLAAALVWAVVRRDGVTRLLIASVAVLAVLGPWLLGVLTEGLSPAAVADGGGLPLWRALAVVPDVLPGTTGLLGIGVAVAATAVLVAALLLGFRGRPAVVTGFAVVLVLSSLGAWGVARLGVVGVWRPALLLPSALAQAGLGVVAARWFVRGLRVHAFGLRQVAVVASVVLLAGGLVAGIVRVGQGPATALVRGEGPLPPFVTADEERVGPYRVLVLRADPAEVRYELLGADGPTMTTFNAVPSAALTAAVDDVVATTSGGADPRAGARLGTLGVRYVVADADPEQPEGGALIAALDQQPRLQPEPSGDGRVYRVDSWLPRAVVLPRDGVGAAVLAGEDPGLAAQAAGAGLDRIGGETYRGDAGGGDGVLVVSEARSGRWRAEAGGGIRAERLTPEDPALGPAVNVFAVPASAATVQLAAGGTDHLLALAVQLAGALALCSLALRPPTPRARGLRPEREGPLPASLVEEPRTPVAAGPGAGR